jgi:uncharacterized membrane protein
MARVKFHPVHMLLVHFPAALFPMDFIFVLASQYFGLDVLATTGYYCLLAGVIFGWLAVFTGVIDFFIYLLNAESVQMKKGIIHACIETTMLLGFTFVLSVEYKHAEYQIHNPTNWLLIKAALIFMLFVGNFYGGELVLRYISKRFMENS